MSSLLEELESRGVTAEDLEKAASVRLFEKAAAAEGVDLGTLDQEQIEELYSMFVNSNPSLMDDEENLEKEANAMNEEIVELFEKQAEAEGIDLNDLNDQDLATMYNHYVESVLPEQVEEYEKEAAAEEIEEAHAKLAEAEILGRHMARSYMDEFDKEAATAGERLDQGVSKVREGAKRGVESTKQFGRDWGSAAKQEGKDTYARLKERAGQLKDKAVAGGRAAGRQAAAAGKSYGKAMTFGQAREAYKDLKKAKEPYAGFGVKGGGKGLRQAARQKMLRGGAKGLAAWGATGAAAYGGKKLLDKRSSYHDLDVLAEERANEFLNKYASEENYEYDNTDEELDNYITDRALEMLIDAGYDFE